MNTSELILQLQHLLDNYGDRKIVDASGNPLVAVGCIVSDKDDPYTLIVAEANQLSES